MTNEHPVDPDSGKVDDATIVVNAARGAEPDDEINAVSDETIVVTSDETVVVSIDQTVAGVNDHTVVVTRDEAHAAGDETIMVPADATLVVPANTPERRRDRRLARQPNVQETAGSNPAPPVEDTRYNRDLQHGVGTGLDLERPIAPVPGTMPWEMQPAGERGLSQGLPVSYGARMRTETPLQAGVDEAQRRVGPAPDATPVYVVNGRPQLPSIQRKDRRRKRITLAIYGGVILACGLGLWWVAAIAFG